MQRSFRILALPLLFSACFDGQDSATSDSFQDEDIPMGGCSATGGCTSGSAGDEGAPVGGPCDATQQCADSGVCVAPFSQGDPGALVCRMGCVQTGDATSWCSDDASCCSGLCSNRGLCLASPADGSTTALDGGGTTSSQSESDSTSAAGSTGSSSDSAAPGSSSTSA